MLFILDIDTSKECFNVLAKKGWCNPFMLARPVQLRISLYAHGVGIFSQIQRK
jgi:hypothetical protein